MPGIVHTQEVQIGFLTADGERPKLPQGEVTELGHPGPSLHSRVLVITHLGEASNVKLP